MTDIPVEWKRARSARFWRCPNGHTEPHVPFDDLIEPGPGHAARACKVCRVGMELVVWHFLKGVLIDKPVLRRKPVETDAEGNVIIIRKQVPPRSVLKRVIRRMKDAKGLGRFRKYEIISQFRTTNKATGEVTVKVSRQTEAPLNGHEKRYIVLRSSKVVGMSIEVTIVGAHGWFVDVKEACKKTKIHIVDVEYKEPEAVEVQMPKGGHHGHKVG